MSRRIFFNVSEVSKIEKIEKIITNMGDFLKRCDIPIYSVREEQVACECPCCNDIAEVEKPPVGDRWTWKCRSGCHLDQGNSWCHLAFLYWSNRNVEKYPELSCLDDLKEIATQLVQEEAAMQRSIESHPEDLPWDLGKDANSATESTEDVHF